VQPSNSAKWLLLIHQIPAKPDYLRVKIGRGLRQLGAVAIKNSVYVVPAAASTRSQLALLSREILRQGGEAVVCEAQFVGGLADGAVEDLLRKARDAEYSAIAEDARRLAAELGKGRSVGEARRRQAARMLERLHSRFDEIVARDAFGARGRETTARLISLAEDRVQGVEEAGRPRTDAPDPPKGATWVTRAGVMVDRISSAWLIRRFIDRSARFKFVTGRGYRPGPGEIRFDMAAAEFTHENGQCTFEVLTARFRLGDSALKPIAEIVHDLDLEDEKYGRPEAAGVDRLIVGLSIAKKSDEARLDQGAALFDNLYESFRRRSH